MFFFFYYLRNKLGETVRFRRGDKNVLDAWSRLGYGQGYSPKSKTKKKKIIGTS